MESTVGMEGKQREWEGQVFGVGAVCEVGLEEHRQMTATGEGVQIKGRSERKGVAGKALEDSCLEQKSLLSDI